MNASIAGRSVVVVGLGRTGESVARLARSQGAARVTVQDRKAAGAVSRDTIDSLVRDGIAVELGGHDPATLAAADVIVVSPGVPDFAALVAVEASGVPVVSEIEFAAAFRPGSYVGITGTNGKSTVTTLCGEMMRESLGTTFVGGNLGTPLAESGTEDTRFVLELSSYQLERTNTVRFQVAVLLNLTADHLDRYGTMVKYGAAKQRILRSQTRHDHAVVPGFDPLMLAMARATPGSVHTYGTPQSATRVDGGAIVSDGARFPLELLRIRGRHNVGNAMAAIRAAQLGGATTAGITRALADFMGLSHRMQFVREFAGVAYYDDSKATNVGATLKALDGCDRPVVLIAGGRDKGGSYEPLRPVLAEKGRALVVLGEARELLARALGDVVPFQVASDLDDAVRRAARLAREGDCVLLAPACSSLDMFANYEARGRAFCAAVHALGREADDGAQTV